MQVVDFSVPGVNGTKEAHVNTTVVVGLCDFTIVSCDACVATSHHTYSVHTHTHAHTQASLQYIAHDNRVRVGGQAW